MADTSSSGIEEFASAHGGSVTKISPQVTDVVFTDCPSNATGQPTQCESSKEGTGFLIAGAAIRRVSVIYEGDNDSAMIQLTPKSSDTTQLQRNLPKSLGDWSAFELDRRMTGDERKRLACVATYTWWLPESLQFEPNISQDSLKGPQGLLVLSKNLNQ